MTEKVDPEASDWEYDNITPEASNWGKDNITPGTADCGYDNITPEEAAEVESKGLGALKDFIADKLEQWKKEPLNVAIIGDSGVGKSSFINAVRKLKDYETCAARVDVVESTKEPTAYPHPYNKGLKFWDLPGVGTPSFPKNDSYLDRVNFGIYDFFLIICAGRFTEDDLWLAKKIEAKGKKFFLVRAKIDMDISNAKRSTHPTSFKEEFVLKKIKDNCSKELEKAGFSMSAIFLISNAFPERWDFPLLCNELITNLPKLKQQAMILSLDAFSADMAKKKKEVLRGRLWIVSSLSAAVAAVPIPGLSIVADLVLISKETTFYMEQFGLDDESLSCQSVKMGKDSDYLKNQIKMALSRCVGKRAILILLKTFAVSMSIEEASRYIPLFGSLVSGAISYGTTYKMLEWVLEKLEEQARIVLKLCADESTWE